MPAFPPPAPPALPQAARYGRVAATLHWALAVLLLAQVAFGFLLDDLAPRGTPARAAVINLHKSCGLVLAALVLARVLWRLRHRPPAWSAAVPSWQRAAATWGHRGLYACMVLLPLSGYVASNFSRHGVKLFGVALKPWGPDLPAVYEALGRVHDVTGWLFAALIAGHAAAALHHALVARDGVFGRMWPWGA